MDEKTFKKNFVIVAVAMVAFVAGIAFFAIQSNRVDGVVLSQQSEIDSLENRKQVLEAGNTSGTGGKANVAGLDEARVERDSEAIQAMLDELKAIGDDESRLKAFKKTYGVQDASSFQITLLPEGDVSPVDGADMTAETYCTGISGSTYDYMTIVTVGGSHLMTIEVEVPTSSDDGVEISGIELVHFAGTGE